MQRVELKRIVDFFWKAAPEEKAPLARGEVTDNGTIPKEIPEEEVSTKMSLIRKLCFVLSLQVGILYVVGIAWILPCNEISNCTPTPSHWDSKFLDIVITTDSEVSRSPSLALFGYAAEGGGHMAALATSSGKTVWNESLDFIPRKITCYPGGFSCLVSGENLVRAFNSSNGHPLWQTAFPIAEGDSITSAHLSPDTNTVVCTSSDTLFVLNSIDGSHRARLSLPCSSPLATLFTFGNDSTLWRILCEDGELLELWTVDEENAINSVGSFSNEEFDSSEKPDWQRTFRHSSGRPFDITCVVAGHFTDAGKQQVAVILRDGARSAVYILDLVSGIHRGSVPWTNRKIVSAKTWPSRKEGSAEGLILEMMPSVPSREEVVNFSDPRPPPTRKTNFSAIRFGSAQQVDVREVYVSENVIGWSVSPTELLVLKELSDGSSEVSGRRLPAEDILCTPSVAMSI